MINYTEIKKRIIKEAQIIRIQTVLGTSVTISKVQACRLLDTLERRAVEANIEFTEIRPNKFLVTIDNWGSR